MKVRILGSAAAEAFPALFCECDTCVRARAKGGRNIRARHSVMVNDDMLIDFNSDMYMHTVRFALNYGAVRELLITHSHEDHLSVDQLFMRGPVFAHPSDETPLNIYGNAAVGNKLENTIKACKGRLAFHEVHEGEEFMAGQYKVRALKARHMKSEECLLYVVSHNGKSFLYGTDSGPYPDDFWFAAKGLRLDAALLDCTSALLDIDYEEHMNFARDRTMRQRMLNAGLADEKTRFIATHFSHNGLADYDGMVRASEGTGFEVAYDGMEIEL